MDNVMATRDFERFLRETIGLSSETVGVSTIRHALKRRMAAASIADPEAYWGYLAENQGERQALIDAVVVPETWFFRDRNAFDAMIQHLRGMQRAERSLRLLSLPCSTGEEPYSIAMALLDAGFGPRDFTIDAIDVSSRSISRAMRAVYGRNSFRGAEIGYRDRHFEPVGEEFQPREAVRRQVRFARGNLLDPAGQPRAAPFDVIFCRNLLIYFDQETQATAFLRLRQMLREDGLLLVGPSESGLPTQHGFASIRAPKSFAFVKAVAAPVTADKPMPALKPRPVAVPPAKPARGVARPFAQRTAPAEASAASPDTGAAGLAAIERAANAGRLDEARAAAERHIAAFGPSAEALYLLGLACDADDMAEAAVRNYRKALYLAPNHREALAHLSLLLQRQGDEAGARALTARLDRIAKRKDA